MHRYMNYKEIFDNREMAINKLSNIIPENIIANGNTLFIGISLGGAYMAQKMALNFGRDNDILLNEHVKAPNNEELTIAIVTESEDVVIHNQLIDSFDISEDFIYNEARRQYDTKILDNKYKFRQGDDIAKVEGKTVILVDEAIETGLSMYASIKSMISLGAKSIYLLSPIIDKVAYSNLLTICDGVYTPHRVSNYVSHDYYYKELLPLTYKDIQVHITI
ncbi:MAG: phosphoribosyltransferase family protein [Campylobacterota bacterium]|nr:phosphoribosyltransferase family protein [Campylobacterota bacterium]